MKDRTGSWTLLAITLFLSRASAQEAGAAQRPPGETPREAGASARQKDGSALQSAAPSPAARAPLDLDREHRFIWVQDRRKVGETVVTITRKDAERGSPWKQIYHSSSRYRYEREGMSQRGEHDSYYDPSWKPLRYEWHHHWSGIRDYRSRQDNEGTIRGGRLSYTVVHNQDTQHPVTGEIEAPPDGYLYLSQAIDTWAILSGDLLREPRNYVAKVMYPDFLKLTEVTFTFEKEERPEGTGAAGPCRVYAFRTSEGDHTGKVWIDRRGRMVQYVQGKLRIFLDEGEGRTPEKADGQKETTK